MVLSLRSPQEQTSKREGRWLEWGGGSSVAKDLSRMRKTRKNEERKEKGRKGGGREKRKQKDLFSETIKHCRNKLEST